MDVIVNLETRTVLTTRAGDVMHFANTELAHNAAMHAQEITNEPHGVVPWTPIVDGIPWNHPAALATSRAPWL